MSNPQFSCPECGGLDILGPEEGEYISKGCVCDPVRHMSDEDLVEEVRRRGLCACLD